MQFHLRPWLKYGQLVKVVFLAWSRGQGTFNFLSRQATWKFNYSLLTFDPYAREDSSQIAMVSLCKLSTIFVDTHEYSISVVSFSHWRLCMVSSVA